MARRSPPFVVLLPLLLAACATAPAKVHRDVETNLDSVYLQGVSTRYSVRLDELRPGRGGHRQTRLPNALVAGDRTLSVAASLFRHHEVFTLDLVLQNQGDKDISLDRSRIQLFDNRGDRLTPMLDWKQGELYGLRAIQENFEGYHHLGTDFESGQSGIESEKGSGDAAKKPGSRVNTTSSSNSSLNEIGQDFSWLSELRLERETVTLPANLMLAAGQNAPYWAYWRGHDVQYPLTAIVVVGNKRLLFQFDRE